MTNLRQELVKSRTEVKNMMKNASIEIPPEMEGEEIQEG